MVIVSTAVAQTRAELGANIYDESSWEYLSDEYAARQGAGRYVVTALDKLYGGSWNISFRSLPGYLFMEALKVGLFLFVPGLVAMLMAMDADNTTYDTPEARFKRIRNQIVENLKDRKLSNDDILRLQADLAAIDQVLSHVTDRRQWIGAFIDTVIPKYRKARSQELLQQELEALVHNELFEKAADLRLA